MATQSISTKSIVHNLTAFAQRLRNEAGPLNDMSASVGCVMYDVMQAIGLESSEIHAVLGEEAESIEGQG